MALCSKSMAALARKAPWACVLQQLTFLHEPGRCRFRKASPCAGQTGLAMDARSRRQGASERFAWRLHTLESWIRFSVRLLDFVDVMHLSAVLSRYPPISLRAWIYENPSFLQSFAHLTLNFFSITSTPIPLSSTSSLRLFNTHTHLQTCLT